MARLGGGVGNRLGVGGVLRHCEAVFEGVPSKVGNDSPNICRASSIGAARSRSEL